MRLNRREFVRVGSIGAAGAVMTACGATMSGCPWNRRDLDVRIKGLTLVQRTGPSVTVHLVDGNLVGMGVHEPRLIVPTALVDPSSTVACVQLPNDPAHCAIDLAGKTVTMPGTGSQAPDVTQDDTVIPSTTPPSGQWKSTRYTARLGTLSGATQITDTTKFYSSVQINHGHLECTDPESALGAITVWTFKDPSTNQPVAPPQALSDVVLCRTKVSKSGTIFMIGSQTLVLKSGNPNVVTVSNMPPPGTKGVCSGGQVRCIDHLNALFALVNANVIPIGEGSGPAPPPLVDPNYCPPGSI